MADNVTIQMKRHDTRPFLDINLKNSDNTYADLTISGASVTFTMQNLESGDIKVNAQDCEILVPAQGAVRYMWKSTDTEIAGTYLGEFQVTYPSGDENIPNAKITYPVYGSLAIVILEDYDNA